MKTQVDFSREGREFAKDPLEKELKKLCLTMLRSQVPVDPYVHIDCVYLPVVSQTVGSERGDGLECRDGIIVCSHWMSCQTDFYIV